MKAWSDFFSTDYGLMSAGVIAFTLAMGAYFVRFFIKQIKDDEARMKQEKH